MRDMQTMSKTININRAPVLTMRGRAIAEVQYSGLVCYRTFFKYAPQTKRLFG
jgi:hypothetical protein